MIEVENLTRCFPIAGGGEVRAVDEVSFQVAAGEVFALLGPNGAGKTTTLRIILGLLKPTSGHARIGGHDSAAAPDAVKRQVGLVSASAALYQHLTVREMLLFCADLYHVPPDVGRSELARLAALLDFEEILGRRCATLSTGQRQRVHLARALIHRPPVLLLDEPTSGLDVLGSQVVAEFIAHLRGEGKAVLLTTHQLDEAERLGDRFGLLHRGRLVRTGTLPELQASTGCQTLVEMFLKLAGAGPALRESCRLRLDLNQPADTDPSPQEPKEGIRL